jgi:peptide deformylase
LPFPADKFISPVEPTNIHDVQIVEEVLRETADKVGEAQVLSNGDEHLEKKLSHIFSHMVRDHGIGKNAFNIGKYHKMRLMHFDRRWANDRFYPLLIET